MPLFRKQERRIFFRYVFSGGTATAVHFLLLIVLVETVHANATWATALGFCLACAVNYLLQYYWTFASTGAHRIVAFRYAVITLAMLALNTLLFWMLHEKLGIAYLLAQALATSAVLIGNFTINRLYTFTTA